MKDTSTLLDSIVEHEVDEIIQQAHKGNTEYLEMILYEYFGQKSSKELEECFDAIFGEDDE